VAYIEARQSLAGQCWLVSAYSVLVLHLTMIILRIEIWRLKYRRFYF